MRDAKVERNLQALNLVGSDEVIYMPEMMKNM